MRSALRQGKGAGSFRGRIVGQIWQAAVATGFVRDPQNTFDSDSNSDHSILGHLHTEQQEDQ
jgi:hypothetical protein